MTRHPPQQGPPPAGYQGNDSYEYEHPQDGNSEPQYGAYSSNEGQTGYGQPPNYRQPAYGSPAPGTAQSYYGQNDQPYQQYPPTQYGGYEPQYQSPPGPPPSQHQYLPPQPTAPQQYGGESYAPTQYPPYGQQYPPQPTYGGPDEAAFRSHYEQPHGAIDPATGQPVPPGAEGDRGVMGALAGGAAGAYAGHKMHHGILGGIGGAVAGSMLEDAYKKHNKEKKQRKRRDSDGSCSSDSSDDGKHQGPPVMVGNFCESSRHIRLEDHTLVAECADVNGHHHTSTLNLNDCFTNSNGQLRWARGGDFAASARNIRLTNDRDVLEAELGDGRGGWVRNRMLLNERITNDNGVLAMI